MFRFCVNYSAAFVVFVTMAFAATSMATAGTHILVVVGIAGDDDQQKRYDDELRGWENLVTALHGGASPVVIRPPESPDAAKTEQSSQRAKVMAEFQAWQLKLTEGDDAVLVLIGMGATHDGAYQFQIRGPRLTGKDIDIGLAGNANSYTVFATGPGSSGLVSQIAGERRLIVSATADETEINQTQFGLSWLEAAEAHPDAPLVKLLIGTEEKVAQYYKSRSLARTEHATLTIGSSKPVEAPFTVNLPASVVEKWTLASIGAWVEKPPVSQPAPRE